MGKKSVEWYMDRTSVKLPGSDIEDKLPNGGVVHIDILTWSGLKAPAEPSCRVPTYIVYFFKFILGGDFS